ncbi:MAG: response regulator [Planctomycetes bacterium]|nr:response regulator [Planctomycetota bacterium]
MSKDPCPAQLTGKVAIPGMGLGWGKGRPRLLLGSLAAIFVIALPDYFSGSEVSFSIFYLFPILFVARYQGLFWGTIFSLIGMLAWGICDILTYNHYSSSLIFFWNTAMRGIIFFLMSYLLNRMSLTMDKLSVASDEAHEATRAKSAFLANMSHEIRTPLNSLVAIPEILLATPLSTEQRRYVEIFRREGQVLLRMINDILDLSKIEAKQMSVEYKPFHLDRILEEVSSLMNVRCKDKGLSLEIVSTGECPKELIGDATLLRRVLVNLVGNAIKFTEKGKVALKVSDLKVEAESCRLEFLIEDTGIGIPEDKLQRLFKPFSQADDSISRVYGGTGLGLSISKNIVEILGGEIGVESEFGKGSLFRVALGFGRAEAGSVFAEAQSVFSNALDERPLKILLADDYEPNRLIVKTYLASLPYTVDEAEDGREAVLMSSKKDYDIILMDVQMPNLDGYAATREIRSRENQKKIKNVPIIALTAHAYKEDIQRSKDSGCDAHITKPVNGQILRDTIRSIAVEPARSAPPAPAEDTSFGNMQESDFFKNTLLPKYLKSIRQYLEEAGQSLKEGQFEPLVSIGHKLRGTGSTFGFPGVSDAGGRLEEAAERKDAAVCADCLRAIKESVESTGEKL